MFVLSNQVRHCGWWIPILWYSFTGNHCRED